MRIILFTLGWAFAAAYRLSGAVRRGGVAVETRCARCASRITWYRKAKHS